MGSAGEARFTEVVRQKLGHQYAITKFGIESLLECLEKVYLLLKALDKRVEALAKKDEETRRLLTVPGVGVITALTYRIEIDNPHRFTKSISVGAYLGMPPREYSSWEAKR